MKNSILLFILLLSGCDKLADMAQKNWNKRHKIQPAATGEIEDWKKKLAITEAELTELEKNLQKMMKKTSEAGSLSWKIARAYMKTGRYELGLRFYNKALEENSGNAEVIGAEVHFFESAVPYFNKALLAGKFDDQLLFETGLAYANAARDMGWEKNRRDAAIDIFKTLARKNPEDSRYPYQLALVYFDSSMTRSSWGGLDDLVWHEEDRAMRLLDSILIKESKNIPVRFARANFLYRMGKTGDAKAEYMKIKRTIEELKETGVIEGDLEKNQSYRNALSNLEKIGNLNE